MLDMVIGHVFRVVAILLAPLSSNEVVPQQDDTPQIKAIRQMHDLLKKRDWGAFYRTHCHSELKKQLSEERFSAYLSGKKGKPVVDIFGEVLKAVDNKAGKDTLIAQDQKKKGEYEFILVKVKALPYGARQGRQWHLELKLEKEVWKFRDTD